MFNLENVIKCNLCSGKNFGVFLPAYIRSKGLTGKYILLKCKNCGLVFLSPQPNWKELTKHYPESYYLESSGNNNSLFSVLMRKFDKMNRGIIIVPGGRLLDVGCGNGDFLSKIKQCGMDVFGIEPGTYGHMICKARGLNVVNSFLENSGFPDSFFDVVTVNHVLEHTPDPKKTLSYIKRILKPSGVAIIQIPNLWSFAFLISHKYYIHLDVPRHLFHFTQQTLEAYAKDAGLKLIKVEYYTSVMAILESLWLRLHHKPVSLYDKSIMKRNRSLLACLEFLLSPFRYLLNKLWLGDVIEIYLSR